VGFGSAGDPGYEMLAQMRGDGEVAKSEHRDRLGLRRMKVVSETPTLLYESGRKEDIRANFWQIWEREREYLYRCCLKWM
jgi:hypothetical protein